MLQYFRFILYALTGFFLFIIVYVTFFSSQYRGFQNSVPLNLTGTFSISAESGTLKSINTSASGAFDEIKGEDFLMDKQTNFNTYFISNEGIESYNREISADSETISVGEGEYYFNFEDPLKKYSIISEGYSIDVLSEGKIYIKDTGRKIGFYSFDGLFKVHFKDIYTNEFTSSFYVFPGMYAKGSTYRKQTGVDEKTKAASELFYINNLQLTSKKKKEDSDTNVIMYSFSFIYNSGQSYVSEGMSPGLKRIIGITTDFIDQALVQEKKNKDAFKKLYGHFEGLKTFETPLFSELEGYFSIFFNKSKKVVYYKNLILKDLAKLVEYSAETPKLQKTVSKEGITDINNIFKNLEALKSISEEDYLQTKQFLNDFYYYFHHIHYSDYSTKQNIRNLYTKLHGLGVLPQSNDTFLSHLFTLYNNKELTNLELNKGLIKYIVSTTRILSPEDERSFYYYYYGYNKILKNHIQTLGVRKDGFEDIIRVFENTSFINEGYFKSSQAKKGMLYINAEIIENIIEYLATLYFEEERNADDLLVLKSNDINIDDVTILNLEENINYLFLYQKNANILDKTNENEAALLQKYERFKNESEEYFEAIINNDDYMNAEALKALQNIGKKKDEEYTKPSEEKARKYLSSFTQVDTSSANVEVVSDTYYQVESFRVASDVMSFDLHPLEFNKITNIKKATNKFTVLGDILRIESERRFKLQDGSKISKEELYNYFVDLGDVEVYLDDIEIVKNTYFKIKNINIGGVKYSFLFFPKTNNEVKDVMEGLGVTYKLDNLKPEEGERDFIKKSDEFKNFFIELISKTQEIERELVIENGDDTDSVAENIFKNDFLFGKDGDFTGIKDKILLRFDNVRSQLERNSNTTYIDKVPMLAPSDFKRTNRGEVIRADMTSEYTISEFQSYFEKTYIQFYFIKGEGDYRYDFGKEKLQVLGKLQIEDFDDFYNNLWDDYTKMSAVHETKETILGKSNVGIFRYSADSRDAILTYEHKSGTITITFQKGEVFRIKYKGDIYEGADLKKIENIFGLFL